jgi:hypothetical protein
MKSPLEVNGIQADYVARVNEVFVDGMPIEPGSMVTVCSWCSPKSLTVQLSKHYQVSHGLCASCDEQIRLGNRLTEEQAAVADHWEDKDKDQRANPQD